MNLVSSAFQIAKYVYQQKSYWAARYRDGKEIFEWECDWSNLPRKGLIEARLHCPDGRVAVVGNPIDASDRLFQLKIAVAQSSGYRAVLAHVLGILEDPNGNCSFYAWEYSPVPQLIGPLQTNIESFNYGSGVLSTVNYELLGAKPD